ncbi:MAG: hypothetical protein EB127_20695 [Alphaproteobacteria bacterium]|nr:hypothetical protein [Alphaproteobacteria bacterium]
MNENELRDKLRKIESLFSSATMEGEKEAALNAINRIKAKLAQFNQQEKFAEFRFSLSDKYSRQLFIALCRKYNIRPYRHAKQKQTSVMIKASETFINDIFYPEFEALNKTLVAYLNNVTEKIIREEIYPDVSKRASG